MVDGKNHYCLGVVVVPIFFRSLTGIYLVTEFDRFDKGCGVWCTDRAILTCVLRTFLRKTLSDACRGVNLLFLCVHHITKNFQ